MSPEILEFATVWITAHLPMASALPAE